MRTLLSVGVLVVVGIFVIGLILALGIGSLHLRYGLNQQHSKIGDIYVVTHTVAGFTCTNCDPNKVARGKEPLMAPTTKVLLPANTHIRAAQALMNIDGTTFLPAYAAGPNGIYNTTKLILVPVSALERNTEPSPSGAVTLDQVLKLSPIPAHPPTHKIKKHRAAPTVHPVPFNQDLPQLQYWSCINSNTVPIEHHRNGV